MFILDFMARKLTTSEFIKRARKVHGELYDYTQVEYESAHKKVKIVCSIHGIFSQSPSNHLSGKGCNICGGSTPVTFNEFVLRAHQLHGGRYSYDEVSFSNMRNKTKMSCKIHGEFWQEPYVHLRPNGCSKCAKQEELQKTESTRQADFVDRLNDKFGMKITLKEDEYHAIDSELLFHCEYHGDFRATPRNVVYSKHGCSDCYKDERLKNTSYFENDDSFLSWVLTQQEENELFKGYTFSLLRRERFQATIAAKCNDGKHAPYEFILKRNSSNALRHCRSCVTERRNVAVKGAYEIKRDEYAAQWRQSISEIYGDEYDVSEVTYLTASDPIAVCCRKHGLFQTTPDLLLHGGCRSCANEELRGLYSQTYFDKNPEQKILPAELYYLKLQLENFVFYKVGITKGKTKNRHAMLNTCAELTWSILQIKHCSLEAAWKSEHEIQRKHGDLYRVSIPMGQDEIRRIRLGPSECFSVPLNARLLSLFESDKNV